MFDLGDGTIRRYIYAYDEARLDGLRPGYGLGRPSDLTWADAEWLELLSQSPADLTLLESRAQNWTPALLRQYLAADHEVQVTQATLSKALRWSGIRWRRAKWWVLSPNPLYVVKRQRLAQLEQLVLAGCLTSRTVRPDSYEPPKAATLDFLDSTDLHWCLGLGPTNAPVSQQVKVDTLGPENPRLALSATRIFHRVNDSKLFTIASGQFT